MAGSDGRAPAFRPGQMYGGIFLVAVGEGAESASFNVSCPDCVFLVLLCTEKNTA